MKLYKFDEFVNEMVYCKIINARWYHFDNFIRDYVLKLTNFNAVLKRNGVKRSAIDKMENFDLMYENKFGKEFDLLEFYGMTYELVQSDKGDKFVFNLDDKHSIQFYPMCDETKPVNAANYNDSTKLVTNPKYNILVVYAVDNGVAKKLDTTLNNYYLSNTCTYSSKEYMKLYDILDEYVAKWKIKNDIDRKNSELDVIIGEMKVFMEENVARENREREERLEKKRLEKEAEANAKEERVKQKNDGIDVVVTHKGNVVFNGNFPIYRVNQFSINNIRYLLATRFKLSIEDAISKDVHPDTSDMTNLENTTKGEPVYTPRNLPKDHYDLVDYYRTYGSEMCEHCGKYPIVNVMVIKNPKGEVFHVGNECVSHLVDIPEEEFEEEWNAPFKLANGIMNKIRTDKNKNFDGRWYIYGDMCYYISSANPLLDCPFFDTSYLNENGFGTPESYKLMKRDFYIKMVKVSFMKRMLPRYYKNATVVDFNIFDMYNIMTNPTYVKNGYWAFHYNGEIYHIPKMQNIRNPLGYIERKDYEFGEYSQKCTNLGMGDYNMEYTFGDTTISYKWKSIPV